MVLVRRAATVLLLVLLALPTLVAQSADQRLDALKQEAIAKVDARAKLAQEMVDSVFSFGAI
jgi:hypothetical protein